MSLTPPLSLNEIGFYTARAAAAAGAPWGVAEDLACTARHMARCGEDPAPSAASALARLDSGRSGARLDLRMTGGGGEIAAKGGGALSAVFAAPAACDWLIEHADTKGARLRVTGADVPRLVTAAAETLPGAVRAQWAAETPSPGGLVFIRRAAPQTPAPAARAARGGVRVDAAAWEEIQTLFRRCLVPSTEASRLSGAGAGVNDTD